MITDSFPIRQPYNPYIMEYINTYKQPQIFTQLPNEST